jgi:protein gp37
MAEKSGIAWTDATFNPWWGCEKLSEACAHCYAERDAKRFSKGVSTYWGKDTARRFFNEGHWGEPYKWNAKARKDGYPLRVFCGSMCDIFEDRVDLNDQRMKLWKVIEDTPNLIWLLLTKRPANIVMMIPFDWKFKSMPLNVWFGTTVENQYHVDRLMEISVMKNWTDSIFVSVEPMLGAVDFGKWWDVPKWVIVGGESGAGARRMIISWAEYLRNECIEREIPFFMKQLGGFPDKRDNMLQWDTDLRIRQFPKEMRR